MKRKVPIAATPMPTTAAAAICIMLPSLPDAAVFEQHPPAAGAPGTIFLSKSDVVTNFLPSTRAKLLRARMRPSSFRGRELEMWRTEKC